MKTLTKQIVAAAALSASLTGGAALAHPVDDGTCRHTHEGFFGHILDVIEAIPGVIELTGIRFPVTHYRYEVSDTLTRGSRLDKSDYPLLASQGFKTIVDLTMEGTDDTGLVTKNGMMAVRIPILDNTSPSNDQMKALLDIMTAPENQPVYVHCEAGKGRTGIATAVYRMAVEGWSTDDALAEAKKFGLATPTQEFFIKNFGCDLANGKIDGYPLAPLGSGGPSDAQRSVQPMSPDPEPAAKAKVAKLSSPKDR